MEALLAWAEAKGATTTAFMSGRNMQITKTEANRFGRPSFIGSNFIDPATYPPTHTIRAIEPPNVPLADLFTVGMMSSSVTIWQRKAVSRSATKFVSAGTQEPYTVRGIVSVAEESSVTNFLNAFFGFAYFDLSNAKAVINEEFAPNRIGVSFPQGIDEEQLARYGYEVEAIAPAVRTTDVYDFLERYEVVSQYLSDFVVVMGLGALLIGGVGIMNTMLVLVRRRTNEIAAVKTFGLHGHQVAALFLSEGLLLGLIGSLLGMVVGVGLSLIVNEYGSVALRQPLIWRIYPEALVFGFTLGMVVTAIFGVAPILTAVKVRPSIILRPNENHLVALGIVQSIMLLVFVTISLGLVVGHIIRPSFELTARRFEELRSQEANSESEADLAGFQASRRRGADERAGRSASALALYRRRRRGQRYICRICLANRPALADRFPYWQAAILRSGHFAAGVAQSFDQPTAYGYHAVGIECGHARLERHHIRRRGDTRITQLAA